MNGRVKSHDFGKFSGIEKQKLKIRKLVYKIRNFFKYCSIFLKNKTENRKPEKFFFPN